MPKLLIIQSYLFVLYSADVAENRRHVHVESKKGRFRVSAKFWLEPKIEVVNKGNFHQGEINKIMKLIKEHEALLNSQIDKFLKGKNVKIIKIK